MLAEEPASEGNRFFRLPNFRFDNAPHLPFSRTISIVNATIVRAAARQHKADLHRSLRLCIAEGIMAMPLVTMSLPVNVFMTALVAKAFPLPKTTIGLISALPFFGNFLQILAAPFLNRWKPPKTI